MKLEKITSEEVLINFESFHEKNKSYYIIIDDEEREIGLFGVKKMFDLISDCAEISVYIFKKYRYHCQYKKLLKLLLDFPFLIKFKCILIHTTEESVKTLLKMSKRLGVVPIENTDETWFYRKQI